MHADQTSPFRGYAALEKIYDGSRSAVYRARSSADGRAVILKAAHSAAATLDRRLR